MEKIDKQGEINEKIAEKKDSNKPVNPNGRPPAKLDEGPRKKRVDTPKSKPGVAEFLVWTENSYDKISSIANRGYLAIKDKSTMRELTRLEAAELESLKLDVLSNIEPMSDFSEKDVTSVIGSAKKMPKTLFEKLKKEKINIVDMNMVAYKRHAVSSYIEHFLPS